MKFKEVLKKSLHAINKTFLFVLIYYLLSLSVSINRLYKPPIVISLLLLSLGLVIHCGVLGAILKIIDGKDVNFKSFIEGIKFSFFRYIGAFLTLVIMAIACFIPYFIFARITKGSMAINEVVKTTPSSLMKSSSMLLFTIFSIYIFPFVFVKGKGADAFFHGIKYLYNNFKKSISLIIMGVIKVAIPAFLLGLALRYPYNSLQYISLISINSLVSIYIELAIFAGACYILGNE